jgi:hypothetical protein
MDTAGALRKLYERKSEEYYRGLHGIVRDLVDELDGIDAVWLGSLNMVTYGFPGDRGTRITAVDGLPKPLLEKNMDLISVIELVCGQLAKLGRAPEIWRKS